MVVRTFVINGKTYRAKPFDFNLVCDLDDMGISMNDADKKPMSLTRAYLALCMNVEKEIAGKELEAHLVNGGTFDDVTEAMAKEMETSDFFQNLSKSTEQETTKDSSKKKKVTEI